MNDSNGRGGEVTNGPIRKSEFKRTISLSLSPPNPLD